MKKILLTILLLITAYSCTQPTVEQGSPVHSHRIANVTSNPSEPFSLTVDRYTLFGEFYESCIGCSLGINPKFQDPTTLELYYLSCICKNDSGVLTYSTLQYNKCEPEYPGKDTGFIQVSNEDGVLTCPNGAFRATYLPEYRVISPVAGDWSVECFNTIPSLTVDIVTHNFYRPSSMLLECETGNFNIDLSSCSASGNGFIEIDINEQGYPYCL